MTSDDFRAWRKALGLTQTAAAQALGLGKSTVELYEAGKRRDNGAPVDIPHTVALACSALYHRLSPWGEGA
ncbi:helix-turn-helix transcriptional regulator [Oleispirillum naphthae]|uniref:helix-turn-helix domain-containing protein n=1 Tax=Oleispirillum naphthae TaxID=2838853 RepID=UPI0030822CA1